MDFQSAMETFAEAWVAANAKGGALGEPPTQTQALALTRSKSPPVASPGDRAERPGSPPPGVQATPTDLRSPAIKPESSPTPSINVRSLDHPGPDKDRFDLSKTATAKSLPLHCIVESTAALQEACLPRGLGATWRRRSAVETDSYVIIPTATAFHDIVAAALQRLGYPSEILAMARGSVIIKNWKPLSLDLISDNALSTVGDVLGELTAVATLRITVLRPPRPPPGLPTVHQQSPLAEVKDKLLRLLVLQSHGVLRSTGCPLDEITLSQICRGTANHMPLPMTEPSIELLRKFDQWFASQLAPSTPSSHVMNSPFLPSLTSHSPVLTQSPRVESDHHVHPALQTVHSQYPSQKTRMRTSFDPELELPKLQRWFMENQHPSRQQIQSYVRELNNLESRRGRKPLDINNVVYWFKNARAAQKRAELRGTNIGCHLGLNGYNDNHSPLMNNDSYLKSPLSNNSLRRPLSSMSEENLSNNGSDDEINMEQHPQDRALSPDLPLSLTMRKSDPEPTKIEEIKQEAADLRRQSSSESPENHDVANNNKSSMSDQDDSELDMESLPPPRMDLARTRFRSPSPSDSSGLPNRDLAFPLVPNSMFSHSIMYMSHYIPTLSHSQGSSPPGGSGLNLSALSEDRRKRNRTFIDPVTEVPRLEQWFTLNTHPSHNLILKYTEELNRMPYRQKFPRLESKNVQFWFKNRRAKCKRLKMSLYESSAPLGLPPYE